MKRIITVILVVAMLFAFAVPAFAVKIKRAEFNPTSGYKHMGKVTVKGNYFAYADGTHKCWKLSDVNGFYDCKITCDKGYALAEVRVYLENTDCYPYVDKGNVSKDTGFIVVTFPKGSNVTSLTLYGLETYKGAKVDLGCGYTQNIEKIHVDYMDVGSGTGSQFSSGDVTDAFVAEAAGAVVLVFAGIALKKKTEMM